MTWAWKVWETLGGHRAPEEDTAAAPFWKAEHNQQAKRGRRWWTCDCQWSGLIYTIWMESNKLDRTIQTWQDYTNLRFSDWSMHALLCPSILTCQSWMYLLRLFLVKHVGFNLGVIPLPCLWYRRQSTHDNCIRRHLSCFDVIVVGAHFKMWRR